jgi:hypothetical protein
LVFVVAVIVGTEIFSFLSSVQNSKGVSEEHSEKELQR